MPDDGSAPPRTRIMGILNVTPDSFSDGGLFADPGPALAHAVQMADEGADLIDVGAESTRPGHVPVDAAEEWRRLAPVLSALPSRLPGHVAISIDTTKAEIAERAVDAGATVLNDQWGFQRAPAMARIAAERRVTAILMHNRDGIDPGIDIVADICRFFDRSLGIAREAGVADGQVVLDPGVGFGKTVRQNFETIAAARHLMETFDLPLLYGISRKSFIGRTLGREVDDRLAGTLALNAVLMAEGVAYVRVHDVAPHVDAARLIALRLEAEGSHR